MKIVDMRNTLIKKFGFDHGFTIGFMVMEMNQKMTEQDFIQYYNTVMQYQN